MGNLQQITYELRAYYERAFEAETQVEKSNHLHAGRRYLEQIDDELRERFERAKRWCSLYHREVYSFSPRLNETSLVDLIESVYGISITGPMPKGDFVPVCWNEYHVLKHIHRHPSEDDYMNSLVNKMLDHAREDFA
jgi:hypothetical protein